AAPAAPSPAATAVPLTKTQLDFFEAKVRPVLVANCYKCHAAENGKAKGGLVLDTREGWLKGGENGAALVAGDPDKSLLVKAISYADADLQMPPNGNKLTPAEIADLTAWVKMGAPDPRTAGAGGAKLTGLTDTAKHHWAFQPVKPVDPPAVKNAGWAKTPVDAFVLAKLEAAGMAPSRPAAREALIRRASYDLTGLPPTPEEVHAFQIDQSPTAFEKVVDRLLASPAYGERWGRFWLDSARYSDTTGIENLNKGGDYRYAYAWTYRDYVINAFNADKPYDVFLKEQVAADLLPSAKTDPSTLTGLGFITVGKRFQNPNDQIDERIDALTKSTMALTVACARCHDHKFDPIPTADYYSLHGVFNSLVEPDEKPVVGSTPDPVAYADYQKQLAAIEGRNQDQYYKVVEQNTAEFYRKASAYLQTGLHARKGNSPESLKARNALIAEHKLDRDLFQSTTLRPRKDDELFLPLMAFAELEPADLPGKAKEVLDAVAAGPEASGRPGRGGAKGDRRGNLQLAVNRLKTTAVNPLIVAAFKDVKPEQIKTVADAADVYAKLFASVAGRHAAFVKANREAKAGPVTGFADDERPLLNYPFAVHPASDLNTEGLRDAIAELRLQNGGFQKFNGLAAVNELQMTHPGSPARAMVINDAPTPRNSPVFIRGEAQNRGPVVPRQFLEIVAGKDRKPFTKGSGRLELAEALASPANPLTARVAVNRIWMHHFGDGIVRTVDDMGVMCDPPSHPELLDYLAGQFVADGWSVKKMHKLVMLSAAYQQSSDTNVAYAQKDPGNRLLWRANLRRLDFEAVRDTMLLFTGKLDRTIGGKPVNLTDEPYSYRRSVYGYIDRGGVPELMQQFDFADPDMANSKRTTTIVPQQALFFMNSPMSVDVARKVTSREEFATAADDVGRVKALYEVLFQRAPKATEVQLARAFVSAAMATEPEQASKAAKKAAQPRVVENKVGKGNQKAAIKNSGTMVDRRPLNAWEQYAQALLMANEVVYVN
ncbi:MAG: hypothetical protein JWO31_2712, partial [Phycisphaerales bacterium]|nr:hypothetical protein [Phycisphaerales bacterium]